jgi:sugar phosphate permease
MFGELPLAIFVGHAGWRETLFIASGVGALLTVLLFIVIKDKPESISLAEEKINPSSYSLFKSIAIVLSNPSTWLVALLAALIVGPIAAFAELWSVPFFTQVHHLSRTQASFLSMFVFMGIAVGGPTHGWLSGRMASRMPIIRLGALGALVALTLIIFIPLNTEIVFIPLLFLFGFFSATMLLCFAMNSENNPIWTAGLVVGFTNMFIMGGASLFQPLVGHVLDVFSHNTAHHLVTVFTAKEYHIALSMLLGCQVVAFFLTYIIKGSANESV